MVEYIWNLVGQNKGDAETASTRDGQTERERERESVMDERVTEGEKWRRG